jgi:hypothetical protein
VKQFGARQHTTRAAAPGAMGAFIGPGQVMADVGTMLAQRAVAAPPMRGGRMDPSQVPVGRHRLDFVDGEGLVDNRRKQSLPAKAIVSNRANPTFRLAPCASISSP